MRRRPTSRRPSATTTPSIPESAAGQLFHYRIVDRIGRALQECILVNPDEVHIPHCVRVGATTGRRHLRIEGIDRL